MIHATATYLQNGWRSVNCAEVWTPAQPLMAASRKGSSSEIFEMRDVFQHRKGFQLPQNQAQFFFHLCLLFERLSQMLAFFGFWCYSRRVAGYKAPGSRPGLKRQRIASRARLRETHITNVLPQIT